MPRICSGAVPANGPPGDGLLSMALFDDRLAEAVVCEEGILDAKAP